ncbi:MAG: transposase, partial [Verrucomicrobiales bacterium]
FVDLMRRLEFFCGVQVLTYALMSNHFHILVRVPEGKPELSDADLIERVRVLNGGLAAAELTKSLESMRKHDPSGALAEEFKSRYLERMHDVSVFMKELKGRYAQWFNRRYTRYGVLWAERFKSVLVQSGQEHATAREILTEAAPESLTTMSAYIDLNPVRAELCEDPKEYRYCAYGEAVSGTRKQRALARAGLGWVLYPDNPELAKDWSAVQREYRRLLFGTLLAREEVAERKRNEASSAKRARMALAAGSELSRAELLRCRVRYFSDGLVLGGKEFVEKVFEEERSRFSAKRKTGARLMKGADWGELRVFRDLKKRPVG